MDMLLSVVMPTYNRVDMLRYTLSLLKEQVLRNKDNVELIICNNASTDGTKEFLEEVYEKEHYFKLVHYDDRVDIGLSITRSINNASGRYFLLWSDDDVPGPSMIDVLVDALKRHPDVACITFNRLQGYSEPKETAFHSCGLLYKDYSTFEKLYESSEEFVTERWRGMTFLSADLVEVDTWKKGQTVYTKEHLGWEFLAPILYGVKGRKCLFINYPMCIQRWLRVPGYRVKWPSYIYVGIPRMLKCLEENDVIRQWEPLYRGYLKKGQFRTSLAGYINDIVNWASRDLDYYRPLVKEINKYQTSLSHKLITYTLYLPKWLCKFNRGIVQLLLRAAGKT